jgi:hypothetical protein
VRCRPRSVAPLRCCGEVSRRRDRLDAELRRRWPGKVRRGGALLLRNVEPSRRADNPARAGPGRAHDLLAIQQQKGAGQVNVYLPKRGNPSPVFSALEKGAGPKTVWAPGPGQSIRGKVLIQRPKKAGRVSSADNAGAERREFRQDVTREAGPVNIHAPKKNGAPNSRATNAVVKRSGINGRRSTPGSASLFGSAPAPFWRFRETATRARESLVSVSSRPGRTRALTPLATA